jgi:hypothetical protein
MKIYALLVLAPAGLWAQTFVELRLPQSMIDRVGPGAVGKSIDDTGSKATIWSTDGNAETAYWAGPASVETTALPGMSYGKITRNGNLVYGSFGGMGGPFLRLYNPQSGEFTEGSGYFRPAAATPDGSMLAGGYWPFGDSPGPHNARQSTWTQAGGIQSLYDSSGLFPGYLSGFISGLSANGRYGSSTGGGVLRLYDFEQNTFRVLGNAAEFGTSAGSDYAMGGVSDDGRIVIGRSFSETLAPYATNGWAYFVDEQGNATRVDAPLPEGYVFSDLRAISGDGSVAVGWMRQETGEPVGMVWKLLTGEVFTLQQILGESSPGSEWSITAINGVSSNGQWLVGEGVKDGVISAWAFAAIPEADTASMVAGMAMLAFAGFGRKRKVG